MSEAAHRNASWDFIVRNVVIDEAVITGDTEGAFASYLTTHNGSSYIGGSMEWDGNYREGAWVARFNLPPTTGVLTAVATVSATVNGVDVNGVRQASVKVI